MPLPRRQARLIAAILGASTVVIACGSDISDTRVENAANDEERWAIDPGFVVGRSIFLDGDPRAALRLVADPGDGSLSPGAPSVEIVDSFIAAVQHFEQKHVTFFAGAPGDEDRDLIDGYLAEHAEAVAEWGDLYLAHRELVMSEAIDDDDLRSPPIPERHEQ